MASVAVEPMPVNISAQNENDILTKSKTYDEDPDCILISTDVVKSGLYRVV